jgi:hypothetical protein
MNCKIAMQMTATGIDVGHGPVEVCAGCHRPFQRGEQMSAIEGMEIKMKTSSSGRRSARSDHAYSPS